MLATLLGKALAAGRWRAVTLHLWICTENPEHSLKPGHGIVWDGSVNNELATLLGKALEHGRCVATCGHGAAALLDVKDPFNKDQSFVKNKEVTKLCVMTRRRRGRGVSPTLHPKCLRNELSFD